MSRGVPAVRLTPRPRPTDARTMREHQFVAFGGKLVGKPDVIRPQEIIDYKSGAILEYDETAQSDVVKSAYVRQLRIYGFLVKEELGWWPARGVLLPFAGVGVEVPLDPNECVREAAEAVALLDDYNAKVNTCATPHQLASPSPTTCKWCSFKLLCVPFWSAVGPAWSGQLDGAAVEGVLNEPPRAIHGGAAMSLSIDAQNGSEGARQVQLAPLNPNVHAAVAALAGGDHVRMVGLRARPDGSLVPAPRTVLARVEDLPVLTPPPAVAAEQSGGTALSPEAAAP
jgi:PD-(D/E)XK nuclease superfamily